MTGVVITPTLANYKGEEIQGYKKYEPVLIETNYEIRLYTYYLQTRDPHLHIIPGVSEVLCEFQMCHIPTSVEQERRSNCLNMIYILYSKH